VTHFTCKKPKKPGARSARARTLGQNPLVSYNNDKQSSILKNVLFLRHGSLTRQPLVGLLAGHFDISLQRLKYILLINSFYRNFKVDTIKYKCLLH
jgi:hypothetical protein